MQRLTTQLAFVFFALAAHAIPLQYFDSVLGIQRDGSVVAVEKFALANPESQITWSTSTEFPGKFGIHEPRKVTILQVTTLDGRPLSYKLKRGFSQLDLEIETGGVREIRLVYAVQNAVRFLSDRDELLWQAGEGWRGDTGKLSLFIQVPPELASVARLQAYLGGEGLLPTKSTEAGPDRIWFESPGPVSGNRDVIANAIFPPGTLQRPPIGKRALWFLVSNSILLLPLVTLATMLLLKSWKRLPSPDTRSIVPRYAPPKGMTPAEVGVLLDDSLDPCDVAATLVDLAIRKVIKLEYCKPDAGVEFEGQDFAIRLLKSKEDLYALALHERTLLFHAFYGGEWTKYSSLRLRFYDIVPLMERQILQHLRSKGMYWTDPDYAPQARITMLIIFLIIAGIIQFAGWFSFASSLWLSALSIAVSGAIVYYFGRGITAKTQAGLRASEEILGFQLFLDRVERDRLHTLEKEMFEKWVPMAMALRVEHHWAKAFEGMSIPPPEWMSGLEEVVFNSEGLANILDGFARQTGTSMFIAPRGMGAMKGWNLATRGISFTFRIGR